MKPNVLESRERWPTMIWPTMILSVSCPSGIRAGGDVPRPFWRPLLSFSLLLQVPSCSAPIDSNDPPPHTRPPRTRPDRTRPPRTYSCTMVSLPEVPGQGGTSSRRCARAGRAPAAEGCARRRSHRSSWRARRRQRRQRRRRTSPRAPRRCATRAARPAAGGSAT